MAHFLPALARRGLRLRCVATSLQTEIAARELGLPVESLGPVGDPAELAARLAATPGVVEHGLFPPELVSEVIVGGGGGVERL